MQITDNEKEIIAEFLKWNDPIGDYISLGKRDVIKIFFDVVNKDFFSGFDDDNPTSYQLSEIINISKLKNTYFSTTLKLKLLLEKNNMETYRKIIDMI